MVLEALSSVFDAPELALVPSDPDVFAAPVLLAGADVIVDPSPVAEALALIFEAFAVALDSAVGDAGRKHNR